MRYEIVSCASCRTQVRGTVLPDAEIAALARRSGGEWRRSGTDASHFRARPIDSRYTSCGDQGVGRPWNRVLSSQNLLRRPKGGMCSAEVADAFGVPSTIASFQGPRPHARFPALDRPRPLAAWAQDAVQEGRRDVTDIDLDDLLKVHVTSASKKEQSMNDVAAAVTVLRDEDLRRMGATTVAEAMRAVPGFHVGRNRSSVWAVSPRGFSDELSNKLLVMIDGRSVYSPLHSGVYWDVQDVFMEDVDRIEVVRGPGGTLWGANAVNGVVNIITKPAGETQGGLITAGGGTEERILSGARYGFKAADNVDVRVFAKYSQHDDALDGVTTNTRAYDGWNLSHGGFRADWKVADSSRITFSGNYYEGQVKEQIQTRFSRLRSAKPSGTAWT